MPVNLIPGEFSDFTIAIAVLSGFIVFFGFVSMFLKERLFLSEAFVAVLVGIIAGPLVTNAINPYNWKDNDEFTKQLSRCIIAVQVMAVGIELPKQYLKKEWKTVLVLLFPVMMFMWLVSGLIIWAIIPPVNYLESLIIAACICPTDPILANSVVKGKFAEKHIPANIRNALSAESGANDGMGFPFMFLAIFLIGEPSIGVAVGKWVYVTCLFQIALSCVIGAAVGYVARKILQWSEKHHLIDKPSFLSFAIALALFLMSMTGFSGSDDVLACFVAGNAFSWDAWFKKQTEEAHFQDVIDMMLNLAIFVYIGAIIPWNDFHNLSLGLTPWRLVLLAILILIFRRLPIVMLLKPLMPAMKTYREAAFSGYFGPMGVGAVFLSKIAKEELEKVYINADPKPIVIELINPVVLAIVLSSVLVHGTTIPLFQLGKRIRSRTLSITSLNSHASQVLHLPLFQHRKSEDDILHHQKNKNKNKNHHHQQKEHHYHYSNNKKNSMTELQRNTLYNTIQGERPKIPLHGTPTTATSSSSTLHKESSLLPMYQDNNNKDDDDDDDDIGDYLPDNSHFSATASLRNESFTYFNDDDYENTTTTVNTTDDDTLDQDKEEEEEEKQQLPLPQPSFKQDNGNNNSNISRCGSDSSLEMQGIRFVEPIKPRFSSSQTNLSLHENHGMANIKQWIYKHTSMELHHHSSKKESVIIMEESLDDSTNNNESIKQQHHSGLRHFFKLNHNDHHHQHQNNNTAMNNDHNINEEEDEKKKMKHESGSSTK